jgi:hypothetical protein
MKANIFTVLTATCAMVLASCGDSANNANDTAATDSMAAPAKPTAMLSAVSPSPEFEGATIKIGSAKAEKAGADSAKVSFMFDVKNYDLKMQTADNESKICNNSGQGQHIHFIMDNQPYKALYEPKNEITLPNGTEHYLMAFLSRSYHESVKSPGAALVYHFRIDENGKLVKMDDAKTPMVFYSRPKGDYLGKDTANVLLDYYVWNCTLAPDGYKVRAEISSENGGDATKFTFDKWEPKFITGLSTGKNKLSITLIDNDGNAVDGPCTSATREFKLAAQEPMN